MRRREFCLRPIHIRHRGPARRRYHPQAFTRIPNLSKTLSFIQKMPTVFFSHRKRRRLNARTHARGMSNSKIQPSQKAKKCKKIRDVHHQHSSTGVCELRGQAGPDASSLANGWSAAGSPTSLNDIVEVSAVRRPGPPPDEKALSVPRVAGPKVEGGGGGQKKGFLF